MKRTLSPRFLVGPLFETLANAGAEYRSEPGKQTPIQHGRFASADRVFEKLKEQLIKSCGTEIEELNPTFEGHFKKRLIMTKSEELVYRLCTRSFLSLWSYPNPRGKKGRELCDILVVCEPDIIIFSVKEVAFKDTGDTVGWERWRKAAIEESCSQITGAERWIEANPNVITKDGDPGLPFPGSNGVVHRIAVALGSRGEVPMTFGDSGKGFIHVFDEESLNTLMEELDTISDFVKYLVDKETFYRAGKLTLFDGGGEEDLLALYLASGRRFPGEPDLIVLDDDLWETFRKDPEVQAKKKLDEVSYVWDEIIEEMHQTFLASNLITDIPYACEKLTDLEKAMRVMARENRFSRRLLSISLVDFLENSKVRRTKARVTDSSILDARYVFLISDYDSNRKANMGELLVRCIVARGLDQTKTKLIGLGFEFSKRVEGSATTVCFLEIPDWTPEWQEQMDDQQREFGYFTKPEMKGLSEGEYPQNDGQRTIDLTIKSVDPGTGRSLVESPDGFVVQILDPLPDHLEIGDTLTVDENLWREWNEYWALGPPDAKDKN